jgi:hypothetical protein
MVVERSTGSDIAVSYIYASVEYGRCILYAFKLKYRTEIHFYRELRASKRLRKERNFPVLELQPRQAFLHYHPRPFRRGESCDQPSSF